MSSHQHSFLQNPLLRGSLFVLIASISYGLPASLMKLAALSGGLIANLIISQFLIATLAIGLIVGISHYLSDHKKPTQSSTFKAINSAESSNHILTSVAKGQLMLSGCTIALTNTFFFISLQYISVAIAAVMLMQSVWISTLFDFLLKGIIPRKPQVIAIILILAGTLFATNLLYDSFSFSLIGFIFSFLASICYAGTILVTNSLHIKTPPLSRAFWISLGALCAILILWIWAIDLSMWFSALKWGGLIAVFSVILPLLCFTKGMPLITAGMGGLLSSIELPAAITFAYLLLNETISLSQLFGICLILCTIVFINILDITKCTPKPTP